MRTLVVDDHAIVRRGYNALLHQMWPDGDVAEAATIADALTQAGDAEPDLIILDLQLGGVLDLETVSTLRDRCPTAPILVVSVHTARRVVTEVMERGANGYVAKACPEPQLRAAIQAVLDGSCPAILPEAEAVEGAHLLTRRQKQVLNLIHQGHSNKAIANQLNISLTTVQVHVSAILRALNVQNRTQAALAAESMPLEEETAPPPVKPRERVPSTC